MNYEITIGLRHCIATDYSDASNCAACKAFREQHKEIPLDSMLFDEFYLENGQCLRANKSFHYTDFEELLTGVIDNFTMTLKPAMPKFRTWPTFKRNDNTKTIIKYVSVAEEIKELQVIEN